jgi:alkanesulfonate monooxygenase SsuD/methylene tetrahydromethanopterin reductase-like flavin-dependent oxidoreductase (luciferase family)
MLHTFVGDSDDAVHELVHEPMKKYLGSSLSLAAGHLESVPFLKDAGKFDPSLITPDVADEMLECSFERYFRMGGLFGTPERCIEMVDQLKEIGVDEIACLIDYGVETDTVLSSLENLNEVSIRTID